jgi:hypothetical protein
MRPIRLETFASQIVKFATPLIMPISQRFSLVAYCTACRRNFHYFAETGLACDFLLLSFSRPAKNNLNSIAKSLAERQPERFLW